MGLNVFKVPFFLALALASLQAQNPAPQTPFASKPPVSRQLAQASPTLPATTVPAIAPPAPPAPPAETDRVDIQFPHTSVLDILSFYETLTGKRLIRDSNLAGPEISIMVTEKVSRKDAIKLIESSLLLNGYSIVPVDDTTVKILGPSRAPRSEGLPLFMETASIPTDGDKIISFYEQLSYISPEEAVSVIMQVVQVNAFGAIAPVPNTNAIIITDKTPIVRKALAVLALIDVEPAKVVTEFVPLQRANAENVVEVLNKMFDKDEAGKSAATTATAPAAPGPDGQRLPAAGSSTARYENRLITGKAKFLADKRTNRILVVTRIENFRYVREVIAQLDAAGSFEDPYVRMLNYMPVSDVFPVLIDMLTEAESEKAGNGSSTKVAAQPTPKPTPPSSSASAGGSSNSATANLSSPDELPDDSEQAAPLSATLGGIRLIGDNSSNSIIVFGPPESKQRTKQILELLDRRPKQVYLAVVIGQLRVDNNLDYGVNYLVKYQNFKPLQQLLGNSNSSGGAATVLTPGLFPNVGALPNPASILNPASLTPALSALSGLTIYGAIADSVDVYARFLESTNRFRTLSRPVIYTTNNRKATILSGQSVPVASSSLTTATGGGISGNGSSVASTTQYMPVVLKLEVIPLINSDHEVSLTIVQKNDTITGKQIISGNEYPVIATQKIRTNVRIPNGSTIVLGGLITEDKTNDQEGIPYISRIPVLGSLLGGRTNKIVNKNELIVMIQPVVVDSPPGQMKASAYEGDRTALGRDAQQMAAPIAEQARPPSPWKPTPSPTPKPKKKPFWVR